ncbi:hypothetical protein QYM36_007245 [Artemia franciscana]|uniref:HECT domain-containing protein n=1 Tax=Artemia franciscana TaxID=6661 RepID=A0AA88HXN6_ARTSF|nr:hypothetical protein QYM36_007245 [Artemia franciscana]
MDPVHNEISLAVIKELFNKDIGTFTWQSESQTYWFNPRTFENDTNFKLVGILLGLAVYNTVTLDVRFPPIMYLKLLGGKGKFDDLEHFDPVSNC